MRPAMFAAIVLGLLVACDGPNGNVDPVSVQWMDWPAEVRFCCDGTGHGRHRTWSPRGVSAHLRDARADAGLHL